MSAVTQGSPEGTMGQKADGGSPREQVRALPLQVEALCVRLLPCFPRKHLCRPCPRPSPQVFLVLLIYGEPVCRGGRGAVLAPPSRRAGPGAPLSSRRGPGVTGGPQELTPHHTPRLALNPHRFGAGRCPRVTWGGGRQDPFLVARGATCAGPCITAGVDCGRGAGPVTPRGGPGCVFWPSPGRLPSRRLSVSGCVG